MKKAAGVMILSLMTSISMAGDINRKPLDTVTFQIAARQWVNTQSALLSVNINVSLTNANLVQTRADIMGKLNKIATGEWHITQFDRSQDSSGLEKLFVMAQVRVPQASLTDIYAHAKEVSRPGASYTINAIEFQPDLAEIQQAKSQLRERLYQLVNEELTRLNKVYPAQHYAVNRLLFQEGESPVSPTAFRGGNMKAMAVAAAPQLAVSNEIILTANVQVASDRKGSAAVD